MVPPLAPHHAARDTAAGEHFGGDSMAKITAAEYAALADDVYLDNCAAQPWRWKRFDFYRTSGGTFCAAYVCQDPKQLVVAFRGTDDKMDIVSDAAIVLQLGPLTQYIDALNVFRLWSQVERWQSVSVCGHSLGGALAIMVGATDNVPSVTFDRPPMAAAATVGIGIRRFMKANIVNFRGNFDPVSSLAALGPQFGPMIELNVGAVRSALKGRFVGSMTHSMTLLKEAIAGHAHANKTPEEWAATL